MKQLLKRYHLETGERMFTGRDIAKELMRPETQILIFVSFHSAIKELQRRHGHFNLFSLNERELFILAHLYSIPFATNMEIRNYLKNRSITMRENNYVILSRLLKHGLITKLESLHSDRRKRLHYYAISDKGREYMRTHFCFKDPIKQVYANLHDRMKNIYTDKVRQKIRIIKERDPSIEDSIVNAWRKATSQRWHHSTYNVNPRKRKNKDKEN